MKIIPFLFFTSFVFSIINFSVNGVSLYFYMFIPFIDICYIRYLINSSKQYSFFYSIFIFILSLIVSFIVTDSIIGSIKPLLLATTAGYCLFIYLYHYSQFKYLYFLVSFSVLFACLQYIMSSIGLGYLVDPSKIGYYIWGDNAIQSREGFEDGIILPFRVAGLSKEPGFFSSFLIVCLIFYFTDKKIKSSFFVFLIFLGLILSLSKITIAFTILVPVVYVVNRFIFRLDRINLMAGFAIYLSIAVVVINNVYYLTDFIDLVYSSPYVAETYLHRSIGYYLLGSPFDPVILKCILTGGITQDLNDVLKSFPFLANLRFVDIQPEIVFFSSGGAYILLQYGLGVLSFYLILLRSYGITFYPFLVFSIMTANVNFFAFENWVILGHVYMFVYALNLRGENNAAR